MIIHLIVGSISQIYYIYYHIKISQYLTRPYRSNEDIEVELDPFSYAAKSDANKRTGVDTSSFAKKKTNKKVELASLKSDVNIFKIH